MDKEKTCVGAIAGSFGISGEVRLKSFCSEPSDIGSYNPLTSEDGLQIFQLKITGKSSAGLSAKIDGVLSKEQAEKLKGTRLYADRDKLPNLSNDEYYHADLIGMKTKNTGGNEIGRVDAVYDYGAGPILEIFIQRLNNTFLIPFSEKSVPLVDLKERFLIIDPPEGIIPMENI